MRELKNNSITITKDELFCLIYDFLKRNRILSEFVEESYRYQMNTGIFGEVKKFTAELTKAVIYSNINRYFKGHFQGVRSMFISFNGSFEWCATKQGNKFWKAYLEEKWGTYLDEKYGPYKIVVV